LDKGDHGIIDMVIATIVANRWSGDPVWSFIIGPPGSVKTETLRAFKDCDETFFLSSMRPKALISGFRGDDKKDPSLLPLFDGKVVIFKEFSSILSKPSDVRESILGDLRDVYDGSAEVGMGNVGVVRHKAKFGIIAAMTPAIDAFWSLAQQLGERFLSYRLNIPNRMAAIKQASRNIARKEEMRDEIKTVASKCIKKIKKKAKHQIRLPHQIHQRIQLISDFVARARSQVSRGFRNGKILYLPQPEIGTRLVQQFELLGMGRCVARGKRTLVEEDYRFICRIARDTIPALQLVMLKLLFLKEFKTYNIQKHFKGMTTREVSAVLPVSHETVKTVLEDFRVLGLLERVGKTPFKHRYRLMPDVFKSLLITELFIISDFGDNHV